MAGESRGNGSVGQELILYAASVCLSLIVLFVSIRQLDPNRAQAKRAAERKREIARRLGKCIVTDVYEDQIALDVINPEDINVTFQSIGGLEDVKESLQELVILPLQRPELFKQGKLLRPQKGVLLYGPPGTGKTLLAKAIAKECQAAFINVRIANLMSKWFGDAQKLVTAVFTLAYKLQPCIIFIDEVDSFLGQRRNSEHEAVTNMKTEFMSLWDGFTTDDRARVMVLAATNRPWELDEAILRRLPRHFEIPLPDLRGRMSILKVILQGENVEAELDIERVAELCEGYSGSDLTELCKQAAYFPLRDLLQDEKRSQEQEPAAPLAVAGTSRHKRVPGHHQYQQMNHRNSSSSNRGGTASLQQRPLRLQDFLQVLEQSRPSKEAAFEYRRRWTPGASGSSDDESSSTPGRGVAGAGGAGGGGGAANGTGTEAVELAKIFWAMVASSVNHHHQREGRRDG
eukprot:TRINITY_DN1873_c0_g3_i1.p1 TRINITY_DN1873_c0_g3~~TRINITY_DN1873_c0_g3_i1.p1  ORF type:complete len:459 (+),score=133.29 TRINITY_DN1873_c0_g3_i1:108-1484(+)